MSTVSFAFLFFFIVVLLVYYLFPGRHRWMVLLAGSIFYFWKASGSKLLLVFLGICLCKVRHYGKRLGRTAFI